ncbi:hypothetical protein [Streptomyces sp. NPDC056061]|uniref:hypothetical protein n=1 Tax=Streptomyces sp. NPDC056061 TaxID=3345700 RepID=UPI0035E2F925
MTDRGTPPTLVGPASLDAEHDMLTRRVDLARDYARRAGLNRVEFSAQSATLGVLAPGTSYAVVQRALAGLGIGEAATEALGLRLIRICMPFPVSAEDLAAMTGDLDRVLVVEDKVPFLEGHVKQALYGIGDPPMVVGRHDESGRPLLTARGTPAAEDVARALAARIGPERLPRTVGTHLAGPAPPARKRIALPMVSSRTPYSCSGCPHSASTKAADDTLVGAGIGCHIVIALDGAGRGNQIGLTRMGEGPTFRGHPPGRATVSLHSG